MKEINLWENIEIQSTPTITNGTILDRVKSYEDACVELNICKDPSASTLDKIKIFAKALNEGIKIDFTNPNQNKYYPWFDFSAGGFGFHCSDCHCSSFGSVVAYVTSEEKADHLGKYAIDLYEQLSKEY